MSRVLLQPSGRGAAEVHYRGTIAQVINFEKRIFPFIGEAEKSEILRIFPSGSAAVWGITEAKGDQIWPKLAVGDVVLFSSRNMIRASGIVAWKTVNSELARSLWDTDEYGRPWKYVYLIAKVETRKWAVPEIAKAIGRKPNWIIRGAELLDEAKSDSLFTAFGFAGDPSVAKSKITDSEYSDLVNKFSVSDDLDKKGYTNQRAEQQFLRDCLFGGKSESFCAFCGRSFPVEFLVAAHIKKRAECTKVEKLDVKNIVLPMCTFGCDALYEKGRISAKGGVAVRGKVVSGTDAVEAHINQIVGRNLKGYQSSMEVYFTHHLSKLKALA